MKFSKNKKNTYRRRKKLLKKKQKVFLENPSENPVEKS